MITDWTARASPPPRRWTPGFRTHTRSHGRRIWGWILGTEPLKRSRFCWENAGNILGNVRILHDFWLGKCWEKDRTTPKCSTNFTIPGVELTNFYIFGHSCSKAKNWGWILNNENGDWHLEKAGEWLSRMVTWSVKNGMIETTLALWPRNLSPMRFMLATCETDTWHFRTNEAWPTFYLARV